MTYEELLDEINDHNVDVYEMTFKGTGKAYYLDNTIILNNKLSSKSEVKCTLAEELAHHLKTNGEILDPKSISSIKQEIIARRWAYQKLVGLSDIIQAYKIGINNKYELSNYLEVTPDFLNEALNFYKDKYGLFYKIDNYIIQFDPLGIIEKFQDF
ncbi:MAG: hypothetical protein RR486_15605 [Clostridium sp.]|uniref:ImmA/IrrE family metallo-endopeptidase n=1 Tax=Clostridium sp. TaxID=1506 RepID=UPI0030268279